jgi:hypothetical protein
MGLGGSITPNVEQSATDAEPPWASAMMLSQAFIRSTAFRRNSLLYRYR